MSDAVSALAGAAYEGYCQVSDAGLTGMVTIRGDLGAAKVKAAVKKATGVALPGQGAIVAAKGRKLAWMSPDELLLFCGYDEAPGLTAALTEALAGQHALVANVSDARVVLRVTGTQAREVIAKLTPADVSPGAFGPGQMRRTRLQQVAAGFHMPDETSFEVIAFRSVADYVFTLLSNAARPGGEVGLFDG
ncbi:sarcosine oxidase subunit gamma [Sinisalibacter aestuarii]|uniref:Sarcosine oxidase subunit gamma n=1 Tax=Sinisalibacter aestuarii TaxID=2949426 RepID=A0ABQ5LVN8_9RHOB|nr:sarcosine oxidase subunit gamma family protein [Sinisalibacter aestuarii]GKY89054.1 sarcosine oxidase subunit gamma [Sinisalibacter aestuarii]